MVKPFAFAELLARIKALTRRPQISLGPVLKIDNLSLNTIKYEVVRNNKKVSLSKKEFALLEYLLRHPNTIVSKDQIINNVWNYDADVLPNTMVSLIIGVGGGFFAGIKYQQSKQSPLVRQFGQTSAIRGGINQFQRSRTGYRPVTGEIISADNKSITVKLQDGSSRIVLFSDKTVINKAEQATKNDLKTGQTVAVFGQKNTDGSITAQNIQLNPTVGFGRNLNNLNQP